MAKRDTTQPDQSRFIQAVTIRNFKCFEELKLEGCGQFNLILGDNNVGKTSVLEALLVTEEADKTVNGLEESLLRRGIITPEEIHPDLFTLFTRHNSEDALIQIDVDYTEPSLASRITLQQLSVNKLTGDTLLAYHRSGGKSRRILLQTVHRTKTNEATITAFDKDGLTTADEWDDNEHHRFVSPQPDPDADLVGHYSDLVKGSHLAATAFLDTMRLFAPDTAEFLILLDQNQEAYLAVRFSNTATAFPVAMFGDGSRRLLEIQLEIPRAAGTRLMIDEIDAGIHYSRFATLWRTTLKAAIANNVQLFITTHNVECLRALREVLETEEFAPYRDECRSFTLEKLPDGRTKAYRYDYAQFGFAIDHELELRGRDL